MCILANSILVSKMSQNKGFMNIFDFNFGFNFLESLTFLAWFPTFFWPEIFCTRTTFLLDPYFLESHTPAQLLWLRTWSGQKYFRSRSPFGSLRVRSFHTRSGACSPHFFLQPHRGCPMGPVGPHWVYKPFGLVHRTPKGSGIKIPKGIFITLRKLRFFFVVARSSAFGFLPARNRYPTGTGIKIRRIFITLNARTRVCVA